MPKYIRLMLSAVMMICSVASLPALGKNAKPQGTKPQGTKGKVTLYERSKKAGGKVLLKYKADRGTVYPNVEELAKRSDLIVIGRTLSHKANLSPDERFITQDFLVKVHEVIKGELPRGRAVLVSLPGGTHRFPDGAYAAMVPVGYTQPKDGGIYMFFLKAKKQSSTFKGYRLVSETQGIFAMTNGTVEPADVAADDPVSLKYRKTSAASFLQQIHKAVPRKSGKGKQ